MREKLTIEQLDELISLALGYEASDYAETKLLEALQPEIDAFHDGARDEHTMRQLRISNDARSNARSSKRSAQAIRAAIAALNTPTPSKDEMLGSVTLVGGE